MKRILILAALILAACAPAEPIEVTRVVQVTQLAEVTRQVEITRVVTAEITRLVEIPVTVTATETPLFTPTITPTPTNTTPPTATPTITPTPNVARTATAEALAALRAPRGDGFYLVNVDIAPGVWRSTGRTDNCYWARTRRDGDIIANHFGNSGGTMYVAAGDFQVEVKNCGRWEWLSEP